MQKGKLSDAIEQLKQIDIEFPRQDLVQFFLATAYYKLENLQSCAYYAQEGLKLNPKLKIMRIFIADYLAQKLHQHYKSFEYLEEELKLDPASLSAFKSFGAYHITLGNVDKAIEYTKKQLEFKPDCFETYNNLMMMAAYSPSHTAEDILSYSKQFYQNCYSGYKQCDLGHKNLSKDKKLLRLGFVSGDFKDHVTLFWLGDIFSRLIQKDFEVFCYANCLEDTQSESFKKNSSKWLNVFYMNDEEAAQRIVEDDIDVLIDLSGHTMQNRLGIFALKPAPIQATWLGWAAPTGLPQMDYTIFDTINVKPGEESFCTEKLCHLPNVLSSFSVASFSNIAVDPEPPSKKNGYITFACFNTFKKVNESVLELYAELLKRVPNSKLYLKSIVFDEKKAVEIKKKFFIDKGINESRLIFESSDNRDNYLSCYNKVDIALDPFPVGGATTTHDTVFMGVPLITLFGDPARGRVSASILEAIGCPELIAYSKDEYLDKAVALAADKDRLKSYKTNLRDLYLNSALTDSEAFAEDFAMAVLDMWNKN